MYDRLMLKKEGWKILRFQWKCEENVIRKNPQMVLTSELGRTLPIFCKIILDWSTGILNLELIYHRDIILVWVAGSPWTTRTFRASHGGWINRRLAYSWKRFSRSKKRQRFLTFSWSNFYNLSLIHHLELEKIPHYGIVSVGFQMSNANKLDDLGGNSHREFIDGLFCVVRKWSI